MAALAARTSSPSEILTRRSLGWILCGLALLVLTGWMAGMPLLASWGGSLIPMAPNTALGFLAWGLLLAADPGLKASRLAGLSLLLAFLAGLRLVELATGAQWGLDSFFFSFPPRELAGIPLAQMAGPTAGCFLAASAAGLALVFHHRWPRALDAAAGLACGVAATGIAFFLAHLQGSPLMYGGRTIPMAVNTALGFCLLGAALASAAGPQAFPLRYFSGNGLHARLRRLLLPLVLGATLTAHLATLALPWLTSGALHPALLFSAISLVFAAATIAVGGRLADWVIAQSEGLLDILAGEKERLRVTLRSIGDGVITVDLGGRVVSMNPAAEALTGWSLEQAQGRQASAVVSLLDEESRAPLSDPLVLVLLKDDPSGAPGPALLAPKGRAEFPVSYNAAPIHDDDGETVGAVLVFRDLSVGRRLDRELMRREKIESLALLAGGLAHDFNNLLSVILGNLSLARLEAGNAEQVRVKLGEAEAAAKRATGLTRQLMAFSKGGQTARQPLHLPELVRETTAFALSGSATTFQITGDQAESVWNVDADPGQIAQVVQNLVMNGQQAMGRGGVLTLELCNVQVKDGQGLPLPPGPYVRLSVSDQGPGIPKGMLPHIFDPFFTTKSRGTGLGLASVYSILQRHGGHVAVESPPGQGASFHVYLPASAAAPPAARSHAATARHAGRARVLVMDDDPGLRNMALAMLARLGYEGQAAADGEEALALQRQALQEGRAFDAAILDLTVPGGMGGLECLPRLKAQQDGLPVVVSSGYTAGPELADHRAHGFQAALMKPYAMEELGRLLEGLLRA